MFIYSLKKINSFNITENSNKMRKIQLVFLIAGLVFFMSNDISAQRRGGKIRNKASKTPQARMISMVLKKVASEATKSIEAGRDTLAAFPCATLSNDETNQTIIVDFGESCKGKGSHVHSGKIILKTNKGNRKEPMDISFDNYAIDGKKIEGKRKVNLE